MTTVPYTAGPAKPTALIVLLHGVGSSGAAMGPLGSALAAGLPGCALLAPDGPEPFDRGPGCQWFSIAGITDEARPGRIAAALPRLDSLLDAALDRVGLGRDRLALVGFSQGAMMALAVAAGPRPPAAVVSLAGRLAVPVTPGIRRPAVLIGHGTADPVVPPRCAPEAAAILGAAGFPVETRLEPGLGHAIAPGQVAAAAAHIAKALSLDAAPVMGGRAA